MKKIRWIGVLLLSLLWACQGVPAKEGGDAGQDTETTDTGSDTSDTDTGPHEHTVPGQYHWHSFVCTDLCYENIYAAAALDAEDSIYVAKGSCGDTEIASAPRVLSPQPVIVKGPSVAKLDPEGDLLWRFVAPENCDDSGTQSFVYDLAVSPSGESYVVGPSNCFWTGPDGEMPIYGEAGEEGVWYSFVVKVTADGEYAWHQLWDGEPVDISRVEERDGALYVLGNSLSLWDGPDGSPPLYEPAAAAGHVFPFVMKLDGSGEYLWHTFVGGSWDFSAGLAFAADGTLLISGNSCSPWTGPSGEAPLHAYSGSGCGEEDYNPVEVMLAALSADGEYLWHTFYGNADTYDSGRVAVASTNGIVVMGTSGSCLAGGWTGPDGEAPLNEPDADVCTFVLLLDGDGNYLWHTFPVLGLSPQGGGVAASEGEIFITSATIEDWDWIDGTGPVYDPSGERNIVVMGVDPDGGYLWHSFFGSGADGSFDPNNPTFGDMAWTVLNDSTGHLVVLGESLGDWQGPLGQESVEPFCPGTSDHFVLKLGAGI